MSQVICVIEDNPTTRKLVRITLESEGYEVIEAPDGGTALERLAERHPDLVIEDLLLPDVDGFELVGRLRALPGGRAVPILAFSGYLSKLEEARGREIGFSGYLFKPVSPSVLVRAVQRCVPRPSLEKERPGRGRTILVVSDDPAERARLAARLRQLDFRAVESAGGAEALERSKHDRPCAIVTSVIMTGINGFELCMRVRTDHGLESLPVILVSEGPAEAEDRRLAEMVGASAVIGRTADGNGPGEALSDALLASLAAPAPPPPTAPRAAVAEAYARRLVKQLSREAATNRRILRENARQAAEVAVLAGVSEVLIRSADIDPLVDEILARYLGSSSKFSAAAIYLRQPGRGLDLRAQRGFPSSEPLRDLFGHAAILRRVVEEQRSIKVPSSEVPKDAADELLRQAGACALFIAPLRREEARFGAVVTTLTTDIDAQQVAFIRAVAGEIALGIALTEALARRAAAERRYHDLVDEVDAIVWESDPERSRHGFVSRRAEAVLGHPVEAWLHEPDFWIHHVAPEDRERALDEYRATVKGRPGWFEYRALAADGHTVWLRERARALPDPSGGTRVFGIAVDITDRKALEAQLLQSQKMEAIGRLAGGVAHDFNNLLTLILGRCDLLLMGLWEGAPQREGIAAVRATAERGVSLVRKLLAFSRAEASAPERIDLNSVIGEMDGMLRQMTGESIRLVTRLAEPLDAVTMDARQLEQVLLNLVANARDAMPSGGQLRIETANVAVDDEFAVRHPGLRPGPHVLLSVADTGVGIEARAKARIFEPFFTTKELGRGTGLGLSIVFGSVRQAGGAIDVESEPGRGALFRIYLPSAGAAKTREAPRVPSPAPRGGDETVLLVEDEEELRALTRGVLESLGYRILEARDGVEALEVARAHEGPIDVVLSDAMMPRMNGVELVHKLAVERPELKVLLTSGYPEGVFHPKRPLSKGIAFLPKPFTPLLVAQRLREVLDTRGAEAGRLRE